MGDLMSCTLCSRCNRLYHDRMIYTIDDKPVCEHCLGIDELKGEKMEVKTIEIDKWINMVELAKQVRNPTVFITNDNKGNVDEMLLKESKMWSDLLASVILEIGA